MRRRFFNWLYYKLFGNGQAYHGYRHWELADLLKSLSVYQADEKARE